MHNYGLAVDVSLIDSTGKEVDMGTPFDAFTDLAQPRYEDQCLRNHKLTKQQVANRLLLRGIMKKAGFYTEQLEWWHFDTLKWPVVKKHFVPIE